MAENWNTFIVLDTETSGVSSPSKNQILTIDATVVKRITNDDGSVTFEVQENHPFHAKIEQQKWAKIEAEALRVTGIDLDTWIGEPENVVVSKLVNWIKNNTDGKGYKLLCGYNVIFDKRFLHFLMERSFEYKWTHAFSYRALDVLQLAQWAFVLGFLPEPENFKLETMARHLGVWREGAHDSAIDVLMTIEVMTELNKLIRS